MRSLPSFSATHISSSSASLVPLPLKRRPGHQPIEEEPEVTQRRAQRSPGNGAPNFKGLPPGRKRTGTESGDTFQGVGGSKTAIKRRKTKYSVHGSLRTFVALARVVGDACGRREFCCREFRPRRRREEPPSTSLEATELKRGSRGTFSPKRTRKRSRARL